MIHPSAIVSPGAIIGEDVVIGAYSMIGEDVTLGNGTWIGPHVVIDPHATIGPGCRIFQFASIGGVPQNMNYKGEKTGVRIGPNVIIREFATINRGTAEGGGLTQVGENSYLMAYTHIAHDCRIGKGVVLTNNATLAGHIAIGDYATVGGLAAIHQFVRVGDYAFVGGKSAVVKDVPPYVIATGDRAVLYGLNHVGLKRHGFSEKTLAALKNTYRILFRRGLTLAQAFERVRAEVEMVPEVENLLDFIQTSSRGVTR